MSQDEVTPMTLDERNTQVTTAIRKAEELPTGTDEASAAWLEVSRIEREIAKGGRHPSWARRNLRFAVRSPVQHRFPKSGEIHAG